MDRRHVEREKRTVAAMVGIYCTDLHGSPRGGLCDDCAGLLDYSRQRLDRCPYGDGKPTCKVCPVHCYQAARRASMQTVMRYAGPKMFRRHPWLAVMHVWTEYLRPDPQRPRFRRTSSDPRA
ncbi:MAG TPA: nitrous oxide-stimulated promoter family protein [Vicinamibacterales bacterium]|jgi:hypothetical protein